MHLCAVFECIRGGNIESTSGSGYREDRRMNIGIVQPIVISKLKKNKTVKEKKYLNDALMTSIAGISAAMKNTG